MSLQKWVNEGAICAHKSTKIDISNLLQLVDRSIKDASFKEISSAQRFIIAYNAALLLASILLHAAGYRTKAKGGHHWITFLAIPEILGKREGEKYSNYFNQCRLRRNMTSYEIPLEVPVEECEHLIKDVQNFKKEILSWLKKHHPSLI
ncbi:MAG TPA: hypothetical protein VN457_07390 [Chlamydiales bacterium]|nr:hypothetical protein [Chlamydiales bacterium]